MNRITRLLLLCVFALVGTSAGPVGAASPYGWVRPDGRPVVWNNSQPISYSVDQGPLGRLSNADAVTREALLGIDGNNLIRAARLRDVRLSGGRIPLFALRFRLVHPGKP